MPQKTKDQGKFLINLAYITVIALLVYIFFKYVVGLIFPFVIAFLMVSIINPITRRITRQYPQQRKAFAILLMALLYIVIGMLLVFLVLGVMVGIEKVLVEFSKDYYSVSLKPAILSIWNKGYTFLKEMPPEWTDSFKAIQGSLLQQAQNLIGSVSQKLLSWVTTITGGIPGFIIAFVFTVMLSFFMTVQYEDVLGFFKKQLPPSVVKTIKDLRGILGKTIFRYLGAVLILMAITTVELSVGLFIIGVEGPVSKALAIAIFDALPVFGTGAVMIPWTIIEAIKGNYSLAIGLGVLYGVVSVVRNIIEPKIVGDRLGINPIVSIVSIYFGYKVFGVFGMIFMPMVAQIIIELNKNGTIKLFKLNDTLEKEAVLVPDLVAEIPVKKEPDAKKTAEKKDKKTK